MHIIKLPCVILYCICIFRFWWFITNTRRQILNKNMRQQWVVRKALSSESGNQLWTSFPPFPSCVNWILTSVSTSQFLICKTGIIIAIQQCCEAQIKRMYLKAFGKLQSILKMVLWVHRLLMASKRSHVINHNKNFPCCCASPAWLTTDTSSV